MNNVIIGILGFIIICLYVMLKKTLARIRVQNESIKQLIQHIKENK